MAKVILREVLKKKGISRYKFAQMLKKRYQTTARYYTPEYDPKLSVLNLWAKTLGVKIKDLFRE